MGRLSAAPYMPRGIREWRKQRGERQEHESEVAGLASLPDAVLRIDPPRPWCRACGEDWTDVPCCDVRREILRLAEENERQADLIDSIGDEPENPGGGDDEERQGD